jgi:hypothetical protein
VGRLRNIFGGSTLDGFIRRARQRIASGDLDKAQQVISRGLERYPEAQGLRDAELSVRRAQARQGMQSLRERVARTDDPHAYEELIDLYLEMGLLGEARNEALAYARAHPDKDTPHLLLGEMSLRAFFQDLLARDAHAAHHRLVRAARLNEAAIKPRLLLAELYFSVGADEILGPLADEVEGLSAEDAAVLPLLNEMRAAAKEGRVSLDGLFEHVEVEGALVRDASGWPLHRSRRASQALDLAAAQTTADDLVARGHAYEVVLLQRNGDLMARACRDAEGDEDMHHRGLAMVTRAVSLAVASYARELELGSFRRCTIQGPFGTLTVGQLGNVVTGARWPRTPDAQRLWDRVAIGVEGSLGVVP